MASQRGWTGGFAHVPRRGLRPLLLLYFATPPAQPPWQGASLAHPKPAMLAGSGRWGALRSGAQGEAEGRRTAAEPSAALA